MYLFGISFPPRPKAFWTPKYVAGRLARAAWESTHPDRPWLTRSAVRFLEGWLKPSDLVVEFGAGRSTRWFASRVSRVVSLESDPVWLEKVRATLAGDGLENVELVLESGDAAAYVACVDGTLGTRIADVILVDGAHRDHAARWALDHLREGGLLIIDNANWFFPSTSSGPGSVGPSGAPSTPLWQEVWERLSSWRVVWMNDGVSETLFCFLQAR
jgi:precorrin-6B methylase 2